jgi:glycerol-3-phosphate dehydrogenase
LSGTSEIGNLRKKLHSGVDGLGLGDNAKAALIARLAEMARLGAS